MDGSRKNSILIVDDEKPNLLYLKNLLGAEHILYMTRSGVEAVEKANEFLPDLILLDIIMPGMNGYEVLATLKKGKQTRDIPIIFITGLNSDEDETKGLALGADDYISKPFHDAIVQLRIRNQLKIIRQMRALDKQFKQQTLMTAISQKFLANVYGESLFTSVLGMIGEFMDIAQILLFTLSDKNNVLVCQHEWMHPKLNLPTRLRSEFVIDDSIRSLLDNVMANGKSFCLSSNDPFHKEALVPYRISFHNYIITPVFNQGRPCALLDFSKGDDESEWSASEINLANLVANIFSGIFERDAMEQLIIEKELAAKSSHAKSEFLSRMSHEMRTPMNAILNMTHFAQNEDDPIKKEEYLGIVTVASHDLLRLIENVLDMSDLNAERFTLDSSEFRFNVLLQDVLQQTDQLLAQKRHSLSTDIDPSIPETLVGDKRRLAQAIGCLLSNACKFTPDRGSIRIKASVLHEEDDLITMQIDVTDNGIGISKNRQDILFTAFEQLDGGMNRRFGGAGLGLYLSKTIIEKMGGKIWFASEPDKGSTFSFTFRARRKPSDQHATGTSVSFFGKTALLVDDMEINREILMALLEETHMHFVCAANGREAVEAYAANPKKFDLILMDINMPLMDGVEATRRIRDLGPEGARVPIIAMTANTNSGEVRRYLAAGMTDHLGKPADFGEIVRKINLYIHQPRLELGA